MPNVKSAESALLTIERAQKLDLLIHLITNLRQSLVICGSNGIGKTTLLEELKKCEKDGLPVLSIPASSNLSFESFQGQLVKSLVKHLDYHVENQEVSAVLSLFEKKNHKIVIIIDDAGQLVPGLITTIIQYASENQCLRIVFALTPDEIQLKNNSDHGIEDCHFIEIPPLTKKQCGVFLQNLSAQPEVALSFNDINEPLIEHVYRETHGIPGAIISEVSKGVKNTVISWESYKWIGLALAAGLAVTLGGFFIFDEPEQDYNGRKNNAYQVANESENTVITGSYDLPDEEDTPQVGVDSDDKKQEKERFSRQKEQKEDQVTEIIENNVAGAVKEVIPAEVIEHIVKVPAVVATVSNPSLNSELPVTNSVRKPEQQTKVSVEKLEKSQVKEAFIQGSEQEKNISIQTLIKKINDIETARASDGSLEQKNSPEKTIKQPNKDTVKAAVTKSKDKISNKKERTRKESAAIKDDSKWILKQPENYYTMQLIVLSKRDAVTGFLQEYPKLLDGLKFFQKRKQGGSQFVVIYGSFKDAATASKKMKSLPPRYRKAWIRSFGGLHKMVKK